MDWKEGIDENCAFEIEETIINNIKAGFLSDDEILEECTEDLEYDYPEDADKLTEDVLSVVIKDYRTKFQNTGTQENFLKLKLAFENSLNHFNKY